MFGENEASTMTRDPKLLAKLEDLSVRKRIVRVLHVDNTANSGCGISSHCSNASSHSSSLPAKTSHSPQAVQSESLNGIRALSHRWRHIRLATGVTGDFATGSILTYIPLNGMHREANSTCRPEVERQTYFKNALHAMECTMTGDSDIIPKWLQNPRLCQLIGPKCVRSRCLAPIRICRAKTS